jgi:fibro-slime domain-containing protein
MKQYAPFAFALALVACGGKGGSGSGGTGADASGGGGGPSDTGTSIAPVCGDAHLDSGETCDDGNTVSNDGCSAACQLEPGYACGDPGTACLATHTCGNGIIETGEGCDDHNTRAGDGCDASCAIEPGWKCPTAGIRCSAAQCGDGIVAGSEECDDGNPTSNDGCSATCHVETGFACPTANVACHPTTCGDGVAEGLEQCDDGNHDLGDGCNPQCQREPQCLDGTCLAVCGDGVLQTGEACDDGNLHDFDGCSSTCTVETGFTCTTVTPTNDPANVAVSIVYRDFKGHFNAGTSVLQNGGHIDFENGNGAEQGILGALYSPMVNHKPVYFSATASTSTTHGQAAFDQWYRDTAGINKSYADTLTIPHTGTATSHTFTFINDSFYPLDGRGWATATPPEVLYNNHNFSFTSELRYWFTYTGTEVLNFYGDDDVWVFINNRLALDIGGVHGKLAGSITLSTMAASTKLNLVVGQTYEAVVLQAERHTSASNYELTLKGFNAPKSVCMDRCGDGVTSTNEVCDDGINMGGYGSCAPGCLAFGPRCGDGIIQADHEQCDDGTNVGGYGHCLPTCTLGPRCGDGIVQTEHEQCDDGNNIPNDGCDQCHTPIL